MITKINLNICSAAGIVAVQNLDTEEPVPITGIIDCGLMDRYINGGLIENGICESTVPPEGNHFLQGIPTNDGFMVHKREYVTHGQEPGKFLILDKREPEPKPLVAAEPKELYDPAEPHCDLDYLDLPFLLRPEIHAMGQVGTPWSDGTQVIKVTPCFRLLEEFLHMQGGIRRPGQYNVSLGMQNGTLLFYFYGGRGIKGDAETGKLRRVRRAAFRDNMWTFNVRSHTTVQVLDGNGNKIPLLNRDGSQKLSGGENPKPRFKTRSEMHPIAAGPISAVRAQFRRSNATAEHDLVAWKKVTDHWAKRGYK